MREVLADVERWLAAGQRVALATVISVAGSAPRDVSAAMAVAEVGEVAGSVSGGCVEPAVIEEGMRAIRTGRPKLLQFGISEAQNVERIGLSCGGEIRVFVERLHDLEPLLDALNNERPMARALVISAQGEAADAVGKFLLVEDSGAAQGDLSIPELAERVTTDARDLLRGGNSFTRAYKLENGDQVEVFIAAYAPPPTLIIVGAGHISIPLTKMAKVLGYRVVVADARATFATRERFPEADELFVEWPDEAMARLPLTSATSVAVLTHDDKFDVPALKVALKSSVSYVGAIGSRGTREQRDVRLREAGVTDAEIARIHGPIGMSIGARSPEEIALSILAEVVATRHGHV
jgi:xanthine dehydrogenase accessory factor